MYLAGVMSGYFNCLAEYFVAEVSRALLHCLSGGYMSSLQSVGCWLLLEDLALGW